VPNLIDLPQGCKFAPRCQARLVHNLEVCTQEEPPLRPVEARHPVRCWLYQ
jgi:oligopeptide/dipeptide ABC transporter ATP-binding protein